MRLLTTVLAAIISASAAFSADAICIEDDGMREAAIYISLDGRTPQGELGKPSIQGTLKGTITIEIMVDRDGIVRLAEVNTDATNVEVKELLAAVKLAARATRFDPSEEAPELQRGRIVYEFK